MCVQESESEYPDNGGYDYYPSPLEASKRPIGLADTELLSLASFPSKGKVHKPPHSTKQERHLHAERRFGVRSYEPRRGSQLSNFGIKHASEPLYVNMMEILRPSYLSASPIAEGFRVYMIPWRRKLGCERRGTRLMQLITHLPLARKAAYEQDDQTHRARHVSQYFTRSPQNTASARMYISKSSSAVTTTDVPTCQASTPTHRMVLPRFRL